MKKKRLTRISLSVLATLALGLILFVTACKESAVTPATAIAQTSIKQNTATTYQAGSLVHTVYFQLKDDLDEQTLSQFKTELQKLATIPYLQNFTLGDFESLDDPRALAQYQLVMQMSFENAAAYQRYQKHEIHLAVKKSAGTYIAAAPATHDFIVQ